MKINTPKIRSTRTVKIKYTEIGRILTVKINLSVLKLVYLGQFVSDLSKANDPKNFIEETACDHTDMFVYSIC